MLPHCQLAYSVCISSPLQTAAQLATGERPITPLSRDEKSNEKMRENRISGGKSGSRLNMSIFLPFSLSLFAFLLLL